MAFSFNGTTDYCSAPTAATSYPVTMSCWVKLAGGSDPGRSMEISQGAAANHYWFMQLYGPDGKAYINCAAGGAASYAGTSTTCTVTNWNHICCVLTSATDRAIFLNGGGKATDTTNLTPSSLAVIELGRYTDAGMTVYSALDMAEAAIWTAALSDSEVASLAAGFCPQHIRPASLSWYRNMIRTNDPPYVGSNFTAASGGVAAHPRIYYRRRRGFGVPGAVAAQTKNLLLLGVGT